MAVKPIMGGYPFLTISKKYDIDYGKVLAYSDLVIHGREPHAMNASLTMGEAVVFDQAREDINAACENYKQIVAEGWDQSNG